LNEEEANYDLSFHIYFELLTLRILNKNCDTMKSSDSSSRTGQQPSGAMALLDKYATINNAIDEVRRRSSVAQ